MNPFSELVRRYLADEPYRQLSDDDLWTRFRDHRDESAFRVFLDRCGARIYLRCRALLGEDALAEDAFQDTFAELVRNGAKLSGYRVAVAWLYQSATSKALMILRQRRRARHREERKAGSVSTAVPAVAETELAAWERQRALATALVQLPTTQRRVIELVYLEGMTHAEAADTLGIVRESIGTHVRRGLDRLRQHLGRGEGLAILGAVTIEGALLAHSQPLDRGVTYRLADVAWTRAAEPLTTAGPWWLSWKVLAAVVACAGLVAGGVAIGLRPDSPANPAPVVAAVAGPAEPPTVVPETLQERNVRIVTNEIVPTVRDILQRFYPAENRVEVVGVQSFGSEVELEFRVTPPPAIPALAARLRAVYCVHRRVLVVDGQPKGDTKWYSMNPQAPLVMPIPVPLGFVVQVPFGREAFAAVMKLFDRLTPDVRAEADQIRRLFGPEKEKLVLPTVPFFRGIGSTSGRLFFVSPTEGMYVRTQDGWRFWGESLGWNLGADDKRFYCFHQGDIWSRSAETPQAAWALWCKRPPFDDTKHGVGTLGVDQGRLVMTTKDAAGVVWLWTRPAAGPEVPWEQSLLPEFADGVIAVGGRLIGRSQANPKLLVTRPMNNPAAALTTLGSLPGNADVLVAMGDQLLALWSQPGPIYARPLNGGANAVWTPIGEVKDPPKR